MRQWVLDAEHILDGSWAQAGEVVSNATVGERLDAWWQELAKQGTDGTLSELEQACLTKFLQILANLRPHLVSTMTGRTFHAPTMNWNAAFALSRCSIAASAAARTGTAMYCATDAASRMRPGGSKMRSINSNWSSVRPGSTVQAFANFDGRSPLPRVNNANAFASIISVSNTLSPLKLAGLLLLQRNFCPHGKSSAFITAVSDDITFSAASTLPVRASHTRYTVSFPFSG